MPDPSLCLRLAASLPLVFESQPHILTLNSLLKLSYQPEQVIRPSPKSRDREVLCGTAKLTGNGPGYRGRLSNLLWRGQIVCQRLTR